MRRVFVVVAALALCAYAQEEGAEEEKIEETAPQEESRKEKAEKYVYCESDNCYDLLGVKKDASLKDIKRAFRRLWITRINAAARINGMSYSQFIHGLEKAGVEINRKMLADLAVRDAVAFTAVAEQARSHL